MSAEVITIVDTLVEVTDSGLSLKPDNSVMPKVTLAVLSALFPLRIASAVHQIYRDKKKVEEIRKAFSQYIQEKIASGHDLEVEMRAHAQALFGNTYHVKLTFDTHKNQASVFLSPKNRTQTEEGISVKDMLDTSWDFLTKYTYGQWYEWYLQTRKPNLFTPAGWTFLPFLVPVIYAIPKAISVIREKIVNKYADNPDLIQRELFEAEALEAPDDADAPLLEMSTAEAELYFMQTFLTENYHKIFQQKFEKKIDKRLETLPEVREPVIEKIKNNDEIDNNISDNILKDRFEVSRSEWVKGVLLSGVNGFFYWYIDVLFNGSTPSGILANFGIGTAAKIVLLAGMIASGVGIVVGIGAAIYYGYQKHKEYKEVNEKLKMTNKKYVENEKINIEKNIGDLTAKIGQLNGEIPIYKQGTMEEMAKRYEAWDEAIKKRNNLVENNIKFQQKREELEKLEAAYKALMKYLKKDIGEKWLRKKEELKKLPSEDVEKRSKLNEEIKVLEKQVKDICKLRDVKYQKKSELRKELKFSHKDKISFSEKCKNFIIASPSLYFLSRFLNAEDQELANKIQELESIPEVKKYKKIREEQEKCREEIELQKAKKIDLERRAEKYKIINQKLKKSEIQAKKIDKLNDEYKEKLAEVLQKINEQLCDKNISRKEKFNLKTYKKILESQKCTEVNILSLDDILENQYARPKETISDALHAVWESFMDGFSNATSALYMVFTLGVFIASAAVFHKFLLIGGAALGVGFIAQSFYQKYEEKKSLLREAYLDKNLTEIELDARMESLKKVVSTFELRNQSVDNLSKSLDKVVVVEDDEENKVEHFAKEIIDSLNQYLDSKKDQKNNTEKEIGTILNFPSDVNSPERNTHILIKLIKFAREKKEISVDKAISRISSFFKPQKPEPIDNLMKLLGSKYLSLNTQGLERIKTEVVNMSENEKVLIDESPVLPRSAVPLQKVSVVV